MKLDYSKFSCSKVLVTGASGFIGSHLCTRLSSNGVEVHAVSRTKPESEEKGIRWWQGDLADYAVAKKINSAIKPDLVFHLASHVKGSRDLNQVIPTFRSNLMSLVNILTVSSEVGCDRIINVGSLEEPEPGKPDVTPASPYAATKWAGSAYGRMFHSLYGLPVVNLRVFMVYGPAQKDLSKLVPYVILSLLRNLSPQLSSGKREVDWVFVDDVVDGLIAVAHAPGIEGSTIDIGSGHYVSIRSIVQMLVNLINPKITPVFGALPDRPFEQVRAANVQDTYQRVGWKPKTILEDGIRSTISWYRDQLPFL